MESDDGRERQRGREMESDNERERWRAITGERDREGGRWRAITSERDREGEDGSKEGKEGETYREGESEKCTMSLLV